MVSESLYQFIYQTVHSNDYLSIPLVLSVILLLAGLFLVYMLYQDRKALNHIPQSETFFLGFFIVFFFFTPAYLLFDKHCHNLLPEEERFYQKALDKLKKTTDLSAVDRNTLAKLFEAGIKQKEDGSTEYSLDPVYIFLLTNKYNREKKLITVQSNKYLAEIKDWNAKKEAQETKENTANENITPPAEVKPLLAKAVKATPKANPAKPTAKETSKKANLPKKKWQAQIR